MATLDDAALQESLRQVLPYVAFRYPDLGTNPDLVLFLAFPDEAEQDPEEPEGVSVEADVSVIPLDAMRAELRSHGSETAAQRLGDPLPHGRRWLVVTLGHAVKVGQFTPPASNALPEGCNARGGQA